MEQTWFQRPRHRNPKTRSEKMNFDSSEEMEKNWNDSKKKYKNLLIVRTAKSWKRQKKQKIDYSFLYTVKINYNKQW